MTKHLENNSYDSPGFLKLVAAMKRAKENNRPFTLFIGAGCSLSSSYNSISTESIIFKCIKDHFDSDYKRSGPWEDLYRDFVENVWESIGREDQREILANYFKDLQPGTGYQNLRLLIENKYISQVVTTNFDTLINQALQGLQYKLQVSDTEIRSINGGSEIMVCKVHGDIENGHLRFSPKELAVLPEKVSSTIYDMTKNPCLFCGYRGQDKGVMNSICSLSDYAVFWADPKKPIENDQEESNLIFDLMASRNSKSNFIYEKDFGDFDFLMSQLVKVLLEKEPLQALSPVWANSTIIHILSANSKVLDMFKDLLKCSACLAQDYQWKNCSPFFAENSEAVLNAYLTCFGSGTKISSILQLPENEVETLLIGLCIEVLSRTAGLSISPTEYVQKLKEQFESNDNDYRPDDNFWSALYTILNAYQSSTNLDYLISHISLNMNNNGRLSFNIKKPELNIIAQALSAASVCSLFCPTSKNELDDLRVKSKLLLEGKISHADHCDNKLIFRLGPISEDELKNIYRIFFQDKKASLNTDNKITFPSIVIETDIIESASSKTMSTTISEYISQMAETMTAEFLNLRSAFEFETGKYVQTPLDEEMQNFISSDKTGMFIIGSSGSGKTKALQHSINTMSPDILVAATAPKCGRLEKHIGINTFFPQTSQLNTPSEKDFMMDIDVLLKAKNQTLILIIDGINEIGGGFDTCIEHYRNIIHSIKAFSTWGIANIKIIVTCRDFAFLDYCKSTGLYPPVENCYYQSAGTSILPYYQISPLKLDAQIKFCQTYIDDMESRKLFIADLKNNKFIQKTFNSPYLIALVGNHYKKHAGSHSISINEIFSEFTKQMLQRIESETDRILANKIVEQYFRLLLSEETYGRRITAYLLLQQFDNVDRAAHALNQLKDINLFVSSENNDRLTFSHDRIEEHFLSEFLFSTADEPQYMLNALFRASHDPVFWDGIHIYISLCMEKEYYEQFIMHIEEWYHINNDVISIALIESISKLEDYIKFFYSAKRFLPSLETLVSILYVGAKKAIIYNVDFPVAFIESLSEISVVFSEFKNQVPYFYYIAAKYYFAINNDHSKSSEYCKKALAAEDIDLKLRYLIELQNVTIQKTHGEIKRTIIKYSEFFEYFSANNDWEYAAECILEWGSALRQQTEFDEALKVYQKIDMCNLSDYPALQARLHRKIGTIHKNLLQDILRENSKCGLNEARKKAAKAYYDNAMTEFDAANKLLEQNNDIAERIVVLSEQTEATLKVSAIFPSLRAMANIYNEEEARLLSYLPIPDRKVVYYRELATMGEIDKDYRAAIENLLTAKQYATNHQLAYRIFEVNYQLGRLGHRRWENLTQKEKNICLDALKAALDYPLDEDNQYRQNCVESMQWIENHLSED